MENLLNSLIKVPEMYNTYFKPYVVHQVRIFQPNEKILIQGQKYSCFYSIIKGVARVITKSTNAKSNNISNVVVELTPENSFIGIFSLFDNMPAGATVVAVTEVEAYEINNQSFLEFMDKEPQFGYGICRQLLKEYFLRLREANETVSSLVANVIDLQNQIHRLSKKAN